MRQAAEQPKARLARRPGVGFLAEPRVERVADLSPPELRKVRDYERRNANRKSVLTAIERALR